MEPAFGVGISGPAPPNDRRCLTNGESSGRVPVIATEKELWKGSAQNLTPTCECVARARPPAFTCPRTLLQVPCVFDLQLPPMPGKSFWTAHHPQTTAQDATARPSQNDPGMFPPALQ